MIFILTFCNPFRYYSYGLYMSQSGFRVTYILSYILPIVSSKGIYMHLQFMVSHLHFTQPSLRIAKHTCLYPKWKFFKSLALALLIYIFMYPLSGADGLELIPTQCWSLREGDQELDLEDYNLNTKVGWKVDSNHRKVGYGLIGNLGTALQGKFAWGVHNSLPSLNLCQNLACEYKGFYLRCTNLVIWVQ